MPHPIMFSDDDLGLAEVRKIALGFPEAFEKKIDWNEVKELVDASFRMVAPKKLVKLLDQA
ncbi:MAG TPA: hypothetical protein VJ777_27490 [Mycobacterium sp.]|nr:hypothetical protein [Mycobacterium sp.]